MRNINCERTKTCHDFHYGHCQGCRAFNDVWPVELEKQCSKSIDELKKTAENNGIDFDALFVHFIASVSVMSGLYRDYADTLPPLLRAWFVSHTEEIMRNVNAYKDVVKMDGTALMSQILANMIVRKCIDDEVR